MLKKISLISSLSLLLLNANILENNSNTNLSMGLSSSNIVQNSNSLLNNPAASATVLSNFDTSISLYGVFLDNGLADNINDLNDIDINKFVGNATKLNTLSNAELSDFYNTMNIINNISTSTNNMIESVGFSTAVSFKNLSFGFNTNYIYNLYLENEPGNDIIIEENGNFYKYDRTNNIYITTTQADYEANSFNNNIDTKSTLNNLQIIKSEIPISYSNKLRISNNDIFKYSGTFKLINVKSTLNTMLLSEVADNSSDIFERNTMNTNDIGVGFNFGLIYQPRIMKGLEIGISGNNINEPKFNTDTEDFKLDSQYTLSSSYILNKEWIFSASADLKENKILNYKSQNIGLGVSFKPSDNFNIRAGMIKNIVKDATASLIYTSGISVGFKSIKLDISGAYSQATTKINTTTIPEYVNLQSSIIIDF
jgi:hypothetical protein